MGKKGEALRAAKLQNTRYTFTREQLEERDRAVEAAYKERYEDRLRAMFKAEQERIDAEIAAEWKRREEIFGDRGGNGGTRVDCSRWYSDPTATRVHFVGIGAKTPEEAIKIWNERWEEEG